jgi:signal transduction histidine kinase
MPNSHLVRSGSLRFAPSILSRLGEELVPHLDQGVVELARNAYDANATQCIVSLANVERAGGTITINDDGVGMTSVDINSGWLLLGKSEKSNRRPVPGERRPVGDKGLGRLAALRMGEVAVLQTRPRVERNTEYRVEFIWKRFSDAETVEEVRLPIERHRSQLPHGTTISIAGLRVGLTRDDVARLARALLLLSDPFRSDVGFTARLIAPEYRELEERVQNAYFDEADYRIVAHLDSRGKASATIFDAAGNPQFRGAHEEITAGPPTRYGAPAAQFELWVFLLDTQRLKLKRVSKKEVTDWIGAFGGVHLYYRNLRVHPYGDKGHDWLDMNLARVRSPEERPSTNNSIGRVLVEDPNDELLQKTDRTGFVENFAFIELVRFCQESLTWAARERMRAAQKHREKRSREFRRREADAKRSIRSALRRVPKEARAEVSAAIAELDSVKTERTSSLNEELRLYRTLATVGTTVAAFSHEALKPIGQINRLLPAVERRARAALGAAYETKLEEPLSLIRRAGQSLRTLAELPLSLLQRRKRTTGVVDLAQAIRETVAIFQPFLMDAKIDVVLNLSTSHTHVGAAAADIEAIVTNLLTNAINAFTTLTNATTQRRVEIVSTVDAAYVSLVCRDNGPGIVGISSDDVWLPGETRFKRGTGLGLAIVHDIVTDLGGQVKASAHGALGGAEFEFVLPLKQRS